MLQFDRYGRSKKSIARRKGICCCLYIGGEAVLLSI